MREEIVERLEPVLGGPLDVQTLKEKPGRRATYRVIGSVRSAIAKLYVSDRAPVVAARVCALRDGPPEPVVPEVLLVDSALHLVVLSDVPGAPLREAIVGGQRETCRRAGYVLGSWHVYWRNKQPAELPVHTSERELEILHRAASRAPATISREVVSFAGALGEPWPCSTVVHRDLYEEQIMVHRQIGLIDLDDSASGPADLDLGNIIAHVQLLSLRSGRNLVPIIDVFLDGYRESGAAIDCHLLERCYRLTLLRLACIHRLQALVEQPQMSKLPV